MTLAKIQPNLNVYALKKPLVYQSLEQQGQQEASYIEIEDNLEEPFVENNNDTLSYKTTIFQN